MFYLFYYRFNDGSCEVTAVSADYAHTPENAFKILCEDWYYDLRYDLRNLFFDKIVDKKTAEQVADFFLCDDENFLH